MAKCPKCGEQIISLITEEVRRYRYEVELTHEGMLWESPYDDITDDRNMPPKEYRCPECLEVVAVGDDEAKEILGGATDG